MIRYKLTIAYDGTAYNGWQRQLESRQVLTVQRELEKAAGYIVNHPVTVQGSSRTDTGVHALGQVAGMNAEINLAPELLRRAINSRLPRDILIRSLEPTAFDFDVRSAKCKRYRYCIWADEDRPLFNRQYLYHFYRPLEMAPMQEACAHFLGKHDFEAFKGGGDKRDNTVRTIFACDILRRDKLIIFSVEGSGFLYHMVRTMVGTVLEIGSRGWPPARIPEIIASKDRKQAGFCAPAQGLCLQWIRF